MVEESIGSLESPVENDQESIIIGNISAESSTSAINGNSADAHRRASTGSYQAGSSSMGNSTKNPYPAKSKDKEVPRYLRRSIGSCHDLCKYGREGLYEEEVRVRRPTRKRNVKLLPKELIPVQILVPDEKQKEKSVKPSTVTRRHSLDLKPTPDNTKSYAPRHGKSLEKTKVVVQIKPSADATNHSRDLPLRDTKLHRRATRASLDAKTSFTRRSTSCLTKSNPSTTKKLTSPDPPEVIKSVCFPSDKVEVPARRGSSAPSKMYSSETKIAVPSRQHYPSLNLNPVKVRPDVHGKEQRSSDTGTGKNLAAFKSSTKKLLSPKLSLVKIAPIKSRKDVSLKLVSPLKIQDRVRPVKTRSSNDKKVAEKTLHVIKTESDNIIIESIPDDHAISSFPSLPAEELSDAKSSSLVSSEGDEGVEHADVEADKFASNSHESPEIISELPVQENHSKTSRKGKVPASEAKHGSSVKLKFKTGKVMDLKSENYTPRRLRFRRARVLGAEESKGSVGRTLRKSVSIDNGALANKSSVKVVLKHQDVQDKKDAQGLFNNVIEETASKLVGTRKSKVKALVGAFETVISLQESKPSSSPVS